MTSPIFTESDMFSLKFTRALLFIVAVLTAIYAPPATAEGAIESAGSNKVVLTADELSFLNSHDLGCAMAPNWPPINMYDQDQKLTGVAIDFWEHISKNLGIDVKCDIKDSFNEVTEAIKSRESDFMLATSLTEARKDYAVFSKPYATLPIAIASTVDRGYMPDQSVLVGKRVAVGRGYSAYEILSRSHPDIEFVEVDNTHAGLQMLSEGEVFAVVDSLPVLNWLIKKNNYRNVKVSGITNYNIDLRLMIRSDYPLLGVIFNKGIDLISEQERKQVLSRWFADQPSISNIREHRPIILTSEEQAWLKEHPNIALGYTDAFEPEVIVNPDGSHSGILVDFLEELNRRLGTSITLRIDSIPGILQKAKTKEVDGILEIHPEYADKLGLLKSVGYLRAYPAVFARQNVSFAGPDDFAGKKIAIIDKVYFTEKMVRKYGKQATILRVKDAIQGLKSVSNGDADLFIGVSFNSYYITKYQLFDVVTKYVFDDFTDKFGMAVRPDWPELIPILNKGIASFSQNEIDTIVSKWTHRPQQEKTVELTSEEQAWLKEHPEIRLAFSADYPPGLIVDEDGNVSGQFKDVIDLLNQRLGTNFGITVAEIKAVREMVANKEVAGQLALTAGNGASRGLLETQVLWETYPVIFAPKNSPMKISALEDLKGKAVATLKGARYAEKILAPYQDKIDIVTADTIVEAFRLLYEGKVDYMIGLSSQTYFLTKMRFHTLEPAFVMTDRPTKIVMGVRDDWPKLVEILNKGLKSITEDEFFTINAKWLGPSDVIPPQLPLTPEEQAWLSENHNVRVWVSDWPPFMILRDNQPPTGIAIEYLELIKQRTGINFKYEQTIPSFAEFLESMKQNKGPDISPLVVRTAEREQFLSFTENYITSPNVIIGKIDDDLIWDISGLVGKTVAIPRAFKIQQQLAEQYPEITLVLFDTDEQALQAVATARADAYMGNLTVASHIIQNRGLSDLRVVAPSPFGDHILAMGNRKDWPELTSILNKALLGITQDEKTAILQRYVALRYVTRGLSREILLKRLLAIVAVTIGMVLLVLMWNRVLRNKVMQRTADLQAEIVERKQTENSLRDSELRFRRLIEQSPVSIQIHGIGGELIQSNPAFASLYALNDESLASLYEKYNVLEDEQARQLGLMPFIERVYKGEDIAFPPYEYNGIDTLKSLDANNPVSRKCWVKTLGFPLKDELGRVTSFVFMSEDITEQMQATDELRISESRFRATFEQAAVGIAHVSPKGHFLLINQKFCDIVDYSRDEMLNLAFQEITYSQDLNTDMELVNRLLSGELDTYSLEKRYIRKDGTLVWVNLTVSLLRDDADNPLWFVAVVQDISERKMAEQVIQDYQRRLRKLASRLARTEQMERRNLAVELHDNVGQSLAVMRLQLAAARKDTGGSKADKILSEISSSLREAIADTRDIISNLSSPTLSELGLSAALAEYLQVKIGERYNLETRFSDDDEPKPTNSETNQILYRSVRELLINVVKHANADLVTIDISRRKGDIQIVVEDNGKGETVDRLPKQKTEEGGFGLFSIEERMQDIGGSLMIENVSGQGFRATLIAPLNPE